MATPVGLIAHLPGEEEPFYVEVDLSALISGLKSKVQEARKHTALNGVHPDDLNLWKLEPPMRTVDLCARLSEMDISEFGVEMPSEDPVLNWFPTQPTSCVHFVVELGHFM
ncbi:hypothetical protein BD410DRAFT_50391 [Rickenella mellea]|uniref:Crinkler effector protein N-terminal domain-containing protein n=1 Tax=Rickenella mellea TaxID=50990 RepID=A0A4R5XFT8_9AGAM|nr:hypothetical protein BD410DRAFT_50391 [Rickenella mellea]